MRYLKEITPARQCHSAGDIFISKGKIRKKNSVMTNLSSIEQLLV